LELLLSIGKGVWYGFLIGLLSFGPSFFTLIHTGIQGGKKQGMQVALGIFLSEMFVALLCFFWSQSVFHHANISIGIHGDGCGNNPLFGDSIHSHQAS